MRRRTALRRANPLTSRRGGPVLEQQLPRHLAHRPHHSLRHRSTRHVIRQHRRQRRNGHQVAVRIRATLPRPLQRLPLIRPKPIELELRIHQPRCHHQRRCLRRRERGHPRRRIQMPLEIRISIRHIRVAVRIRQPAPDFFYKRQRHNQTPEIIIPTHRLGADSSPAAFTAVTR